MPNIVVPRASIMISLALVVVAAACAPTPTRAPTSGSAQTGSSSGSSASGSDRTTESSPAKPRVLTLSIPSEPSGMSDKLFQAATDVDQLFLAAFMYLDGTDAPRPLLAQRQPTQADGSWIVNADGTMRTLYTLKNDLKWTDGQPMTADDFVFAYTVYSDDEIPVSTRQPESLMSGVVARDPQTVEILWRQPFMGAASLSTRDLTPLPRHVLGTLFAQDKAAFMKSPFWTTPEFVGSGPFRLTDWDRGVGLTFAANPYFALGQPPLDTVRVVFVADANTVVARMLAGALDVFPTATNTAALTLQERWQADKGGEVYLVSLKARRLYFQFRDVVNHQKAVTDLRVRQALMHTIDRDALATAVEGNLGQAADSPYPKGSRLFPRIDQAIAKYPFDGARGQALLRDAGWNRAADGMLHDAGGRTMDVEIRTTEGEDASIIADYWKQAGVNPIPIVISGVNRRDDEYRANFPATQLQSGSGGYLTNLQTSIAPSAANGWRGSNNRGTYSNPTFDRLFTAQLTTLDEAARDQVLIDLERIITTDLAVGYLMYDSAPLVARSVVKGIRSVTKEQANPFWNIWEWTVEDPR